MGFQPSVGAGAPSGRRQPQTSYVPARAGVATINAPTMTAKTTTALIRASLADSRTHASRDRKPAAEVRPLWIGAHVEAAVVEADGQRRLLAGGGGGRDRLAGGVLDQRVASLERPLRVMGGERGGEASEVAAPGVQRCSAAEGVGGDAGALDGGARRLRAAGECSGACGVRALAVGDRPAGGGPQLTGLLVQVRAVALEVVGGRAGEVGERAGALDDGAAALALQAGG